MSSAANVSPASQEKLTTDRISDGDITCVRFRGVMDESFEGKRLGASIKSKLVVLDMGGVVKISSFGIREWAEFIGSLTRSADQIYMIECTTKVMDQINMVAGLVGKARVVSFYGAYRCDFCDIDQNVLFQVDRDSAAIRSFEPPEKLCESCARPQFFDEDPASYFSAVAQQPQFDLAPGVSEFLSAKLNYSISGGNRRLQIDKHIDGRHTFIRLQGNLDGAFPSEKVGEGLEGQVVVDLAGLGSVDLAGAAEWRNFITLARGGAERIYIVDCPPVLLERLPQTEDIGDEVLSLSMPYTCTSCSTTSSQAIDVEEHYDILKFATPPEMRCENCKQATACAAQETLLSRLRGLEKPTADAKLKSFIKAARKRKMERVADDVSPSSGAGSKTMALVVVSLLTVAAASGVMIYKMNQQGEIDEQLKAIAAREVKSSAGPEKPAWITTEGRYSGTCSQQVASMVCVGISDYQPTMEEAKAQARDVALEAVAFNLAIQFESELFDTKVRPLYSGVRSAQLARYDEVSSDRDKAEYKIAAAVIDNARNRAAEALMASSRDSIPKEHSGLYWEEFDAADGGSEYLVYTRFNITTDAQRAMARIYTGEREIDDAKVLTAYPLIAWSHQEFTGGVLVTEAGEVFDEVGEGAIITSVGNTEVKGVTGLLGALEAGGGPFAVAEPIPEAKKNP